jgi:hypothetical protein
MNADLLAVGGAGGVDAARRWRKCERQAKTSNASIRASDTALTKAGVERGSQEVRHGNLARTTSGDDHQVATNAVDLL